MPTLAEDYGRAFKLMGGGRRRRRRLRQRKPIGKKILKVLHTLAERKHYPYYSNAIDVVDTGTFSKMTGVPQGTTDVTRIGDRLEISNLKVRYDIKPAVTEANLRVIVFQYLEDDATAPVLGSVLETGVVNAFANWDEVRSNKVKIMYDRMLRVPASSDADVFAKETRLNFYGKKVPRKFIQFDNATSTGNNHVYCLLLSDKATTGGPTVNLRWELEFYDI